MKGVLDRRFLSAGLVAMLAAFVTRVVAADHMDTVQAVAMVHAHSRHVARDKRRKRGDQDYGDDSKRKAHYRYSVVLAVKLLKMNATTVHLISITENIIEKVKVIFQLIIAAGSIRAIPRKAGGWFRNLLSCR